MSIPYVNLTPPDADDLNITHTQGKWALRSEGISKIDQLIDRDVTASADGGYFAEAYTAAVGRKLSVATGETDAIYSLAGEDYRVQIVEGSVENKDETGATTVSANTTVSTNIVALEPGYFSSIGFRSQGSTTSSTLSIIVDGEVLASITGTFTTTDYTFSESDYSRFIRAGELVTIEFDGGSNNGFYRETGRSYSGTNFEYNGQDVLTVASGDGYKFTPIASVTPSEISHVVPSGVFTPTMSTAHVTFIAKEFSSGAIVEYRLYNVAANPSDAWDVTDTFEANSNSLTTQDTAPKGIFMKPDGTKMYYIGDTGNAIYEYDLSTAWDSSTLLYRQSYNVAAQGSSPLCVSFKTDGTKMYIPEFNSKDVRAYDLSTAWDVSSAVYNSETYDVGTQASTPQGIAFKSDGTKMYIADTTNEINEYDLSTAWDVSTSTFLQVKDITANQSTTRGIYFRSNGLEVYVGDSIDNTISKYTLSTAWDISTASFTSVGVVDGAGVIGPSFKDDGEAMYVLDSSQNFQEYIVGWDYDDDTGFLNSNELSSFTTFTKEPTRLSTRLSGNLISIKGVALVGDRPA